MSVWKPSELGICRRGTKLSRNLFTSSRHDLAPVFVPNRNRVDGTGVACAQQPLALDRIRFHEDRDAAFIEHEGLGCFRNTVAEANAQRAIDPHAQAPDATLVEIAHMPSRPSSERAVSMTVGVISAMPRSFA